MVRCERVHKERFQRGYHFCRPTCWVRSSSMLTNSWNARRSRSWKPRWRARKSSCGGTTLSAMRTKRSTPWASGSFRFHRCGGAWDTSRRVPPPSPLARLGVEGKDGKNGQSGKGIKGKGKTTGVVRSGDLVLWTGKPRSGRSTTVAREESGSWTTL